MTIGSSDVRRLTSDPARDYLPTWSPDGREDRVSCADHPTSGATVHAVHASTGDQRLLTDFRVGSGGRRGSRGLRTADRSSVGRTSRRRPRTWASAVPDSGRRRASPARSPKPGSRTSTWPLPSHPTDDASRSRTVRACRGSAPSQVVDLDADYGASASPRQLAVAGVVGTVAWSRDGRSIVYDSNARGPWELWRARRGRHCRSRAPRDPGRTRASPGDRRRR